MLRKLLLSLSILLGTQDLIIAQGNPKIDPKAAKPTIEDKKTADSNIASAAKPADAWNPELGILGTLALPIGEVAQVLKMGFGGKLDFNTHIPALPFLKQAAFDIRPGVFSGIALHSASASTKTGSFTTIPVVVYAEIDFTTISTSFVPYFALGSGVAMSMASSTTTETGETNKVSSIDLILYSALGSKFYFGAEKKIFLKTEVGFSMIFEQVSGMFIQGNIGAGVRL